MAGYLQDKPVKKVLVIAYGFPPVGGSSAIRTAKFCKYLPRFSWKPVVLTVKKPRVFDWDKSLLDDLPKDMDIYRTPSMELPCFLYRRDNKVMNKSYRHPSSISKFLGKVFRKIRYAFLLIDERIGWVPFAFFKGQDILRKEKVLSLIYISVKPFSSLFIAIFLKKISGLPLVIDFRDAWSDFTPYFCKDKPGYLRRFESMIEKMAVVTADQIISVNENIIKDFRFKYPSCPASKFNYIPNGFDPEDFIGSVSSTNKDLFFITYAGSLYAQRSPDNFFNALEVLFEERPYLKSRIRFRFLGKITSANKNFFYGSPIKENIQLLGMLPYRECIRKIRESNLLLFIEDQVEISDRLLPSKLFEYMASGRPILCLAKNGPVSELVTKSGAGVVVGHNNIEEIKDKILYFIVNDRNYSVNEDYQNKNFISEYSRELVTKKLSGIFNKIS